MQFCGGSFKYLDLTLWRTTGWASEKTIWLTGVRKDSSSCDSSHITLIKHNIYHPIGKHDFAKYCLPFDIPRIVNDCPNSILDKIITHSLHGFSGYIKAHFLKAYQEGKST